jgi:hypothetical protein
MINEGKKKGKKLLKNTKKRAGHKGSRKVTRARIKKPTD